MSTKIIATLDNFDPISAVAYARETVRDRHERRSMAIFDHLVLSAAAALVQASGLTQDQVSRTSLFVGGAKRAGRGVVSLEWLRENVSPTLEGVDWRVAAERLNPYFPLVSLPNLDLYLAAKYLGITGESDQLTCEPWHLPAALLCASRSLTQLRSDYAIVVSVDVPASVEMRENGVLSPHEVSVAGVVLERTADGDEWSLTFELAVGGARHEDTRTATTRVSDAAGPAWLLEAARLHALSAEQAARFVHLDASYSASVNLLRLT